MNYTGKLKKKIPLLKRGLLDGDFHDWLEA